MIPFLSFDYQNNLLRSTFLEKTAAFLDAKNYVLGQEVKAFEKNFAQLTKSKFAIGVASGLDALLIALKALDINQGDEIIVPSNTYIATWLAISQMGANIIPVEPDPKTYNLDPSKIEEKITTRTKAIMPVHLYGQACNMTEIMQIARQHDLYVVEDNAQAHLAKWEEQVTGTFGLVNATSFYPTKNLGALGEAGCITTDAEEIMTFCRAFRNYGSQKKYVNKYKGINSRIDEIQAAFLNAKLPLLEKFTSERKILAAYYDDHLPKSEGLILPYQAPESESVYHLYVIQCPKRDILQKYLNKRGIGSSIHYPIPPHLQEAYKELGFKKGTFPIAEKLSKTLLSIPLYPGLKRSDQDYIIETITHFQN